MHEQLNTTHPVSPDERSELIEVLRQITVGDLSYSSLLLEFDCFLRSQDEAVRTICSFLQDSLYDDINPDRLIVLSDEVRDITIRCMVFLTTSHCYPWPCCPDISYYEKVLIHVVLVFLDILVSIIYWQARVFVIMMAAHGVLAVIIQHILIKMKQRQVDNWKKFGDFSVWPFLTQDEYQAALGDATKEKGQ